MRGKQMVVLTVEELESIRDEAAQSATAAASGFTVEELKAMREQYEEQLAVERDKREDLEWRLRMAMTRVRDVESLTDKLRAVQESLKGLLGEIAEEERPTTAAPLKDPARRVSPPAVPAHALRKDYKRAIA